MANDGALLLLATAFFILISTGGCSHDSSPASVIQNSSNDHFWHVLNQLEAPTSVAEHHPDLDQISANGPEEPEAPGVLERVDNHSVKSHQNLHGIHVASWRWDEIGIYFTFTTFIIIAGLAKVGFHHAHIISSRIPESCLLILLGTAVGGILYAAGVGSCEGVRGATHIPGCSSVNGESEHFAFPTFTPKLFFLILLPPIILESSYSLYDRTFADNLATVLFYAVIGTVFNTFVIGLTLIFLVEMELIGSVKVAAEDSIAWWSGPFHKLQPTECLVFSSLISAVDPVAVLAIFQEVGINKDLYFLVFGESLLNDAVTVVLYTMMVAFSTMEHISGEQIALGIASFFTVSFGGLSIGIVCGLITALITRTTSHVRVVEPLAVLGMAYFSYLSAELFHFSGIISTIGCGLVQAHYSFANISHKSYTTVKYFIKMISSTSDAIIFLFLGMVLFNDVHQWDTGFVFWTLFLCFTTRFIGVVLLTAVANRFRLKPIDLQEQFIMAYGGLRGAVSFSLVEMLEPSAVRPRQMFVTTTLAVILFTVFVQGGTIKPLVRLLHIQMESKKTRHLTSEINETMIYHLTAGMEEICGKRGNNYIRERIEYLDDRYLRPIFTKTSEKTSLQRLFEKLTISDHYANMYVATGHTGMTPVATINNLASVTEDSSWVEETPLLGADIILPADEAIQVEQRPVRKGLGGVNRNPLVRQQSAPPAFNPPLSATSTSSGENIVDYSDVQLRRKGSGRKSRPSVASSGESRGSSVCLDPQVADQAFRKALRYSSKGQYKRVYQKHNRNLIGEDEGPDELMELALRRLSSPRTTPGTGRFASVVASMINSPLSSSRSTLSNRANSEFGSPTRQASLESQLPTAGSTIKHSERSGSTSRPKTAFAPLRVITERASEVKGQHSTLEIQDVEDDDEDGYVFHGSTTLGAMETGV